MGRPKADIDWGRVDEYLRAHCDGVAIASLLGISPDTLYRACQDTHKIGFADYSATKKGEGVILVEKSIYQDAISKGGADRIFWLKNKAGWKDATKTEITGIPPSIQVIVDSDKTSEELKRLINGTGQAD